MTTELIYTDGACSANGSSRAKGGFGIFIASSEIFGKPMKLNCKGQPMLFQNDRKSEMFQVTNIRMEGLAIVSVLALYAYRLVKKRNVLEQLNYGVLEILNSCEPFDTTGMKVAYAPNELQISSYKPVDNVDIEIVTDSLFWINVIQDWLPKWISKGIALTKKNPDILLMLCYYIEFLKQHQIPVRFTHVKSHQQGSRTSHADGNDEADKLATSSVLNDTVMFERKY